MTKRYVIGIDWATGKDWTAYRSDPVADIQKAREVIEKRGPMYFGTPADRPDRCVRCHAASAGKLCDRCQRIARELGEGKG